ncbi:MAG: secretion system protein E, partial [Sulfuricella sp.]|nr:secretion system protein E [Sulfuricella sp.]
MSRPTERLPLGQLLVRKGVVGEDQLRIALLEQQRSGERLGRLFIRLGFATEATVRDALSENLDRRSADLSRIAVDAAALDLVPKEIAKRHRVFPLEFDTRHRSLTLAMSDTSNIVALDRVGAMLDRDVAVVPMLAGEAEIMRAIDQYYGFELSIDGILHEIETGEIDYCSLPAVSNEYSQPLVRLIDALLADAVRRGASDIHFEPEQFFLRIRYR